MINIATKNRSRWMYFCVVLVAAVFLGGAATAATESGESSSLQSKSTPAADRSTSSDRLVLTNQSVGGINTATPFTEDAIAAALPGYEIAEGYVDPEDKRQMIYQAHKGGKLSIRIYPDAKRSKIMSVIIIDAAASPVIGATFNKIYANATAGSCRAGQQQMSGKVFCMAPAALNVIYVFTGERQGQGGELPSEEVLADWTVSEIVWQPM